MYITYHRCFIIPKVIDWTKDNLIPIQVYPAINWKNKQTVTCQILHIINWLLLCVQEFSEQRFFAFISLCADWSHNDHQNLMHLYTA